MLSGKVWVWIRGPELGVLLTRGPPGPANGRVPSRPSHQAEQGAPLETRRAHGPKLVGPHDGGDVAQAPDDDEAAVGNSNVFDPELTGAVEMSDLLDR